MTVHELMDRCMNVNPYTTIEIIDINKVEMIVSMSEMKTIDELTEGQKNFKVVSFELKQNPWYIEIYV